ncbi:MAG: hypothetical protein ACI81W_000531 [Saprospiraceae bacterium]|jgi:hypothetical protein
MKNILLFIIATTSFFSCTSADSPYSPDQPYALKVADNTNKFHDYWYQGKAEITSFDLEQARYGELHQGNAVLIFVTEDFSKSKKVKLDEPSKTPKDAVSVLKLNATRKFNTGIYPYSMMTSSFTPIDIKKHKHSLKVSTSSQEWCGHTYMELEEGKSHFNFEVRSYFESEGNIDSKVEKAFLEDEIWTRLRIDPKSLPTGTFEMLPGTMFARLRHIDYQAFSVEAEIVSFKNNKDLMTYQVRYSGINRTLDIHFQKDFPYEIEGWEETMTSGFGSGAKTLTTRAKKKKSIMTDYWTKHNNADLGLREELGLND